MSLIHRLANPGWSPRGHKRDCPVWQPGCLGRPKILLRCFSWQCLKWGIFTQISQQFLFYMEADIGTNDICGVFPASSRRPRCLGIHIVISGPISAGPCDPKLNISLQFGDDVWEFWFWNHLSTPAKPASFTYASKSRLKIRQFNLVYISIQWVEFHNCLQLLVFSTYKHICVWWVLPFFNLTLYKCNIIIILWSLNLHWFRYKFVVK